MVSFEGFRAVDGVPIYLQIQTYVRRGCVAGTIRDGDELPSRRVLSALLSLDLLKKADEERKKQASAKATGGDYSIIAEDGTPDAEIEAQIRARYEAKKAKNFAEADRIREALKAAGVEVTDVPGGAKWKRI